jgi:hypothetical protein
VYFEALFKFSFFLRVLLTNLSLLKKKKHTNDLNMIPTHLRTSSGNAELAIFIMIMAEELQVTVEITAHQ